MAYRNLVGQACADNKETFKRFRDFICRRNGSYDYSSTGVGWTLHDVYYAVTQDTITAGDWFVIYSPGETGSDDLYYKITYQATFFHIQGYLYWNNSAHSGVVPFPTADPSNWTTIASTANTLWVYGDLDCVFMASKWSALGAAEAGVWFGAGQGTPYPRTVATSAGALTSGSARSITVDAVPASWKIGMRLFIRDTVITERILISNISGNVITATLANNYLAGSKLSASQCYCCPVGTGLATASNWNALIGVDGTKPYVMSMLVDSQLSSMASTSSYDVMNGDALIVPARFGTTLMMPVLLANICNVNTTGHTDLELMTDPGGTYSWRYFVLQGSVCMAVKEV